MRPLPSWPQRLLRAICPEELYEQIEGDLLELYHHDVRRVGERRARLIFVMACLRFIRPGIFLRNKLKRNSPAMNLLVNLHFTFRHLRRQKLTSAIHITGLTLGISVCLLITLFISHQTSFDGYHQNGSRIYRVNSVFNEGGINMEMYATPIPLAQAIREEVKGVERTTIVRALFKSIVEAAPGRLFTEDRVLVAQKDYMDVFDIHMISGDGKKALATPYQAILSASTAQKFFGDENPIGKTIKIESGAAFTVSAIMRDAPANTSLPASIILSYTDDMTLLDHGDTWYFGGFPWVKLQASTYVLLQQGADAEKVQSQLTELADTHINADPNLSEKIRGTFELQPLADIHFDAQRFGGGPWVSAMNRSWLWFFTGIAGLVFLLACVNFLNLSTAKAATRAREVGIRKSIGAQRRQLIFQFLTEAFLLILGSALMSVVIVTVSLNFLDGLLGEHVQVMISFRWILYGLGAIVITSFLAGIYPALVISRMNPVSSLKANTSFSGVSDGAALRRSLVAVQFIISAVLVVGVITLSRQVAYMHNKPLGIEKDNVLLLVVPEIQKGPALAIELSKLNSVKEVSLSRSSPVSTDHWWNSISQTVSSDKRFSVCAIYGDEHFYSFYGLRLLSGRTLVPADFVPDSLRQETTPNKVVVNEKLLADLELGTPEQAVGKQFWWGGPAEIVGVVADFNTEPLRFAISPTILTQHPELFGQLNIRLNGEDYAETLAAIERVWKQRFPDKVFEATFLDDQINGFYQQEDKIYTMFRAFAILAISISCLGLWGLVAFVTQLRTREVGIRRVLGAPVRAIAWLLSRDFIITVSIAFLIGAPLAYLMMDYLLSLVAYRISIGPEIFSLAALMILFAVLVTVTGQVVRAVRANPVDALRGE